MRRIAMASRYSAECEEDQKSVLGLAAIGCAVPNSARASYDRQGAHFRAASAGAKIVVNLCATR